MGVRAHVCVCVCTCALIYRVTRGHRRVMGVKLLVLCVTRVFLTSGKRKLNVLEWLDYAQMLVRHLDATWHLSIIAYHIGVPHHSLPYWNTILEDGAVRVKVTVSDPEYHLRCS